MKTTVVNIRKDQYDIYIGRVVSRRMIEASLWGNRNRINRDCDRDEAIRRYEHDLRLEFRRNPENLNHRLDELRGKRLGCWCAPGACHGDVLARVVDMSHEERKEWSYE